MKLTPRACLYALPSLLTTASIYCGYQAIVLAGSGEPRALEAALYIAYAMVLDTVDGRVARLTKTQTEFGSQLDSLADVISFGVAPAVLMVFWSLHALGAVGSVIGFLYVACGAARLARFNLSSQAAGPKGRPSPFSQGLSIPSAAGVLAAMVITDQMLPNLAMRFRPIMPAPVGPWFVAVVMLLLGLLMVSTLPFRSFKSVTWTKRTALLLVATLVSSVWVAITMHPFLALLWVFCVYLALTFGELLLRVTFAPHVLQEDR